SFPIGICITNDQGVFELVNDAYCRLYGYEKEELIGQNFTIVVPDDYKGYLASLHDEFIGQNYELEGQWEVQRKDGSVFTVLANASYIINKKGEPQKVTFVVDISQIKSTERSLQDTINRLNQVLEAQDTAENIVFHDIKSSVGTIISISDLLLKNNLSPEEEKKWVQVIKDQGYRTLQIIENLVGIKQMEQGNYQLDRRRFDIGKSVQNIFNSLEKLRETKNLQLNFYISGKRGHGGISTH
ncbi:MAG: PAS domain S-box protein, partial [Bacteroidia bacterium]|nr:PAS domain S-box protein [Bacteroidia bacterium]